jgi:hypothetical protein
LSETRALFADVDPRRLRVKKNLWVVLLVLAGVAAGAWWRFHVPNEIQSVVVYVSHDEVFSEPILKDFEKETG